LEHDKHDPSIRFVRWIKGNDKTASARQSASVQTVTKRTMRLASPKTDPDNDLGTSMLDGLDESVETTDTSIMLKTRWQCLEDIDGIALMFSSPTISTVPSVEATLNDGRVMS
jgi:hypothetical protein